jgi:hypothetical protein
MSAAILTIALAIGLSPANAFNVPAPRLSFTSCISCSPQPIYSSLRNREATVAMRMSLYEDQEKAIVRRGELEEEIMAGAPTEPLQVSHCPAQHSLRRQPNSCANSPPSQPPDALQ